ncbi:kinase-like domain-containing protein [Scheffersomyces coipomensis]|uniref:kinase-like domain-containing protein n=1 Tax=Scheffersomyces coipomensis TaxID=1788519 RepID=UPI00315CF7CF
MSFKKLFSRSSSSSSVTSNQEKHHHHHQQQHEDHADYNKPSSEPSTPDDSSRVIGTETIPSSNSSSHRLFLKKRSSQASVISPQTSSTSIPSLIKKHSSSTNINNKSISPIQRPQTVSPAPSDNGKAIATDSIPANDLTSNENQSNPISHQDSIHSNDNHQGSQTVTPKRNVERNISDNAQSSANSYQSNNSNNSSGHKIHNNSGNSATITNNNNNNNHGHGHHQHSNPLKRFFKKLKPSTSPTTSTSNLKALAAVQHNQQQSTNPVSTVNTESTLYQKYGPVGKLLGTGASGSVNLVTLKTDPSKIFAIKRFRSRLPTENELEYKIKVKNEFKIGEYLNHENLIHTIELIKEYPNISPNSSSSILKKKVVSKVSEPDYYIVMEYCEYDFFNLVMSGLMEMNEVFCYFKQIINGVNFLHENGLSHRDLKLDNCVVNKQGILKLIDFGSAVQFRKEISDNEIQRLEPFEEVFTIKDINYRLIKARGVVGSDPYLSPEVFEPTNFGYDPRLADVWSIAIIFCCMILHRFPWKIPKLSDASYRSFLALGSKESVDLHHSISELSVSSKNSNTSSNLTPGSNGPERLLKLLPVQSRDLIRNMLIIDTKKRYFMNDVVNDEFYKSIDHCHNVKPKKLEKVVLNHEQDRQSVDTADEVFEEARENQHDHEDEDETEVETAVEVEEKNVVISKYDFANVEIYNATNHTHHLITEEELNKLNLEKERLKKLKEAGIA